MDMAGSFLEGFRWDFFSQEQNEIISPLPKELLVLVVAGEDKRAVGWWFLLGEQSLMSPAQLWGDLFCLNPLLFPRGWSQALWLVGETLWENSEEQRNLPEFIQHGWIVSYSLAGCQNSALAASCLFSATARRVCLLCCGADALKFTLIYLKPESGWQKKSINKLLPFVKVPEVTAGICPRFVTVWWQRSWHLKL